MGGVVGVEQLAHALPRAALAIVQPQQRNGQAGAQLNQRVNPVNKEEIDQRVEKCPEHHPEHLLAEIATVGADEQNRHGCDAAPIGGEGDDADQQDDDGLLPRFQLVAVVDAQQHQSPGQRPGHAGLVEHRGLEGDKRNAEAEVIGKMGNECQQEQTPGVFSDVMGVMVALRNEVPHNGRSEPPDDVRQQHPPDP